MLKTKYIIITVLTVLSASLFMNNCGNSSFFDRELGHDAALVSTVAPIANPCTAPGCIKNKPFFNIAHMVNTKSAVDYGLRVGANALEMDMNFAADGTPTVFQHGLPCDCTCPDVLKLLDPANWLSLIKGTDSVQASICQQSANPCAGGNLVTVTDMFNYLANKPTLALIYIDSKITGISDPNALKNAGQKVFDLIRSELYNKGYKGQVIISIPDRSAIAYSKAALSKLFDDPANADLRQSIFFGIDMEKDAYSTISFLRQNGFRGNTVYGTGISACAPTTYYDQIATGAQNLRQGVIGLNIIWTLDKEASIRKYMELGATGVLSNNPETVTAVAKAMGYKISADNRIPLGAVGYCNPTSENPSYYILKTVDKPGWAAGDQCYATDGTITNFGQKPCVGGTKEQCLNESRTNLKLPVQGNIRGGDCGCNYINKGLFTSSGCAISDPPPPGYLCKCNYLWGLRTCNGSNAICALNDPNPACVAPGLRTSKAFCIGDCLGY